MDTKERREKVGQIGIDIYTMVAWTVKNLPAMQKT